MTAITIDRRAPLETVLKNSGATTFIINNQNTKDATVFQFATVTPCDCLYNSNAEVKI